MDAQSKADLPGYLLGAFLIGLLLALLIASFAFGMSSEKPTPPGAGPIFMGLFLVALGLMFAASYFQAWRSFFLRWLLRFSMGFPWLADRRMAFLLSALCIFSGLAAIADGLGIDVL